MRIILAHNNYNIKGGAEVFYHQVGEVLESQGHEVAYFSAADDQAETKWRSYFPPVSLYKQGTFSSKILNFSNMVYNHKAKFQMSRLIKDFKPDIIHAFAIYIQLTPSILDAAREAGVPAVMSCNDYKHICPSYKLFHHGKLCDECRGGKYYRATVNRCSHDSYTYSIGSTVEAYIHEKINVYRKNVHTFLFASEFMAHKTEEFWGKDSFRWKILRNPFDATIYPDKISIGNYALFFGRLIEEKGVDILLAAAKLNPDIPIVIVGDGPDQSQLLAQAKSLGLNHIQFLGPKWGNELDIILLNCRFVVVPSLWHENFPYVILQSFAMGKPVIGSNRGGIPELVVHGERGLIYEANDPAALSTAMGTLMRNESLSLQMGTEAKRFVNSNFNAKQFYQSLMKIYNEVLQ
jgi:glycosyltransferase involved in cell wall biosynthesis